ncbi:MAG: family 20 glycosylhydrolase [Phyllobacterium sp.]|uniref:beta-N-acetylhexosaminidase n=1 Tax=Phyllobacterium sp. TaxID=1871046 RepID=UPI0030F35112
MAWGGTPGYLRTRLKASTGFDLPINPQKIDSMMPCIKLVLRDIKSPRGAIIRPEGYSIVTGKNGIVIRAPTESGLFYGIQTLLQLLPPKVYSGTVQATNWTVPAIKIVDWPRFTYRGTMLDVARRFYTVDEVKRYIDEIALLKINTLHLHLTDDQGWRIVIDELPDLTKIGGTTQSGFASKPENQWFYTRDQYKDIVVYASVRFITILPEIDGPGHTLAAKASIANLNCTDKTVAPYSGFEVRNPTICLDDEIHIANAKAYLKTVLTSLAALTPGPYIHVGGDEAPGMTPAKMIAYVAAASAPIADAKKTLMGWHQIAQGTLPAGTILQYWGDESYRKTIGTASEDKNIAVVRAGLKQGAKFVMSPADHAYLDMKYEDTTPYGLKWEGLVSVEKSYGWDPTTKLSSADGKVKLLAEENILGVEAPLWSDRAFEDSLSTPLPTAPSDRFVSPTLYTDFMAFPRLASASEIGWSPLASHSWDNFKVRLGYQGARWEAFGIGYYKSPEISWKNPSDAVVVNQ